MQRRAWVAFGALLVAYVAFFAHLTALPYQDFPNHLARAVVIADLLFAHGAQFGQAFDFQFAPLPYILGDVLLAVLVKAFGPTFAGSAWTSFVLISLPAALWFYLRAVGLSRHAQLLALVLSLYLATDWFFLLGFTHFRLGLALMIVALGCAEHFRRRVGAWTYVGYLLLLLAGYGMHLTSIVFLAPVLGVTAGARLWRGEATMKTELLLIAPVLALLAWHFGYVDRVYAAGSEDDYPYWWGNFRRKAMRLPLGLLRERSFACVSLLGLFILSALWGLWRRLSWRLPAPTPVLEPLALTAFFAGLYLLLPSQYADASYVDVRALAPLALFMLLFSLRLRDANAARHSAFALRVALVLAFANLAWLATYEMPHQVWGSGYRAVIASLPPGGYVLPVHTGSTAPDVSPRLHMGSFVVTDRGGISPALFSGRSGSHMKYFRYREPLYRPHEFWYVGEGATGIAWHEIACRYEYLLVDATYDATRIALSTIIVAKNDSAALLQIVTPRDGCASR